MITSSRKHHLESFIRETFGEQFGALLLVGYGERSVSNVMSVPTIEVTEASTKTEWIIEIAGDIPHDQEPLVLAALLKLLLSRKEISPTLEFTAEEVLDELCWADLPTKRSTLYKAIKKYLGLTYVKRRKGTKLIQGMYTLLVGYDDEIEVNAECQGDIRVYKCVTFHPHFIDRLKSFKLTFAGIEFGEPKPIAFLNDDNLARGTAL